MRGWYVQNTRQSEPELTESHNVLLCPWPQVATYPSLLPATVDAVPENLARATRLSKVSANHLTLLISYKAFMYRNTMLISHAHKCS